LVASSTILIQTADLRASSHKTFLLFHIQFRRSLLFAPDDPNNLHQTVPQMHVEGLNVPRIKGYRYPAPGSRHGAKVPMRDHSDQLYDTTYAPHDPRNLPNTVSLLYTQEHATPIEKLILFNPIYYCQYSVTINSKDPMLLDSAPIRLGQSPGTNNPAVMAYDATGLRSTMTATWSELDKAVIKNALPDHLPGIHHNDVNFHVRIMSVDDRRINCVYFSFFVLGPEWESSLGEIEAECERKGIPYVMGRKYKFEVSENYNTLRW
jgi:hypothetical protein